MSRVSFKYCVLKYSHSLVLGETFNIGLLFLNESTKKVEFIFPNSLVRLSGLYESIDLVSIRKYLKAFHKKSKDLSIENAEQLESLFNQINEDFVSEFLTENSSSIYFSEIKSGITSDFDKIRNHYVKLFFSDYKTVQVQDRKDEDFLIRQVGKSLSEKISQERINKSIIREKVLKTPFITQEFEFAWENSRLNLITPISFDYIDPQRIKSKSLIWHSTLSLLSKIEDADKYNFDIIYSIPKDSYLFKPFDKAIQRLQDVTVNKRFYQDIKIPAYVDEAIEHLFGIDNDIKE